MFAWLRPASFVAIQEYNPAVVFVTLDTVNVAPVVVF